MNTDIIIHPLAKYILPALLYAEVHYKIFGWPSRYFIKEPEIIADIPSRIDPDQQLPILLLVKDSHRFPVRLERVDVAVLHENQWQVLKTFSLDIAIQQYELWSKVLPVDLENYNGRRKILVTIHYEMAGVKKFCIADNYKQSPHKPFDVLVDHDPLPRSKDWYFGDLHTHSDLTSDQVEFGAPLPDSVKMCKAMGVHFFAATDHSYDLDDSKEDYLQNDPDLPKWKKLWENVEKINDTNDHFAVIPGQELSVGNAKNRNVHFLILNNRNFFYGSGDSAESWLQTQPENKIPHVLNQLEQNAAGIAAHPEIQPPFLQWLLVRRGKWEQPDYDAEGLTGVQMWNGDKEHFSQHGLQKWTKLLLRGKKIALFGGNDAHGNFNIFRQIGLPHFKMKFQHKELFAKVRTGLLINGEFNLVNLMQAIQNHRALVTDGPFAEMRFRAKKKCYRIGDTTTQSEGELSISAHSTNAFGRFQYIRIIAGSYAHQEENVFLEFSPLGLDYEYSIQVDLTADYLRLEVETEANGEVYNCYTNPIYFK